LQVSFELSLPETRRRKARSIQVHRLPHQTASVQEVPEDETGTDPSPLWILLHGVLRVSALGTRESAQDWSTLSRLIVTAQCTNTLERPKRLFEGRWRQDDHPHRLECPASVRQELCRGHPVPSPSLFSLGNSCHLKRPENLTRFLSNQVLNGYLWANCGRRPVKPYP